MAKAGTLKEKVDRLKKKLAGEREKMTPPQARGLRKRLKRVQRQRRRLLVAEARAKAKAGKPEGAAKPEGDSASA